MADHKITCLSCAQANRVPDDKLGSGAKCGTCGASLFPTKVIDVDAAVLTKASRTDTLPLVVDFWAPWCGPCRSMAPEFAKAASALRGRVRFVKLNTEENPKVGQRHNIRSIPTMVRFAGGRERGRTTGALRAPQIQSFATTR